MDELDLSLALLSSESDMVSRKKRKQIALQEVMAHPAAIDLLRLNDPLPLDWEQCLDLQSGRMYYLNRQKLKRSWSRPKEQKLELDLNVTEKVSATQDDDSSAGNYNMVAVVCVHCHLLVMICRSSPCCPNCKRMNNSLSTASQSGRLAAPAKTLKTLSLLH
ncbi:uncharacterized protein LOC121982187 [Zingiber officinale]|uniref:WW domain-containing protein n=1 Tax=Zingiber officinale TaxID=94328 RepID=A0A8J5L2B9_ZINOF|nr:uncharacterized protein LOC121982187 [Zingiber officinale]KAG6508849.1 hypothetical protein ZIOFF_034231 [Zingiber officinale]